jgi:SMC interacting uncharacterized protein involved in chromosome segregation
MKKPISWHQECFANMKNSLENKKEELNRIQFKLQSDIDKLENEILFLELQINTAIKQKKDGFDKDLFLKKDKTTEYIKSWSKY